VAYIDVDEYVVPNWMSNPLYRITSYDPAMNILDIFDANPHLNTNFHYECFPFSRIPVAVYESTASQVYNGVPAGINASSLMTLRYRYPKVHRGHLPGKSAVDISQVSPKEIYQGNHDTHRPIKSLCDDDDAWITPWKSSFVVYHYPGTLEAFLYRDDPRKEEGRRTVKLYYQKYANNDTAGSFEDDSARFWISNFVTKVGVRRARQLLYGTDQAP
jgi:hypothetical protein